MLPAPFTALMRLGRRLKFTAAPLAPISTSSRPVTTAPRLQPTLTSQKTPAVPARPVSGPIPDRPIGHPSHVGSPGPSLTSISCHQTQSTRHFTSTPSRGPATAKAPPPLNHAPIHTTRPLPRPRAPSSRTRTRAPLRPANPLTTAKRHHSEYERPFSLYRGTLDAFLIGSRRNYVRPSVTYAAGLGNTALRHTRLHPEDYLQTVPAHRALPQYIATMLERRPGLYMSTGFILFLSLIYDEYRRTNELYDQAVDSIFALKAKNFLIKQGERMFLETVLIMLHEGVIVPLEQHDEDRFQAAGRFVAEIQGMLAEIERHRDFRLSNVPLNLLEVLDEQRKNTFWYRLQVLLHKPLAEPFHHSFAASMVDGVEFDTPWDIIRDQRALIDQQENLTNFESKLDSAGAGALYGLFYPLITRYHHKPTELSVQAVPHSFESQVRHRTGPQSKIVGRVHDRLLGSPLHDQFQEEHRNEGYGHSDEEPEKYRIKKLAKLPGYWQSDVATEIHNSYYMQRAMNLIKRVHDVDNKISLTMFGEESSKELLMTYLSKAHRVLLERQFLAQKHTFLPGDNHLFRYYYQRYNLVPYLNSLQYEMSELILLRQRLMKLGRAVGIEPEIEQFSNEVLHLLDPFDTRPRTNLRELTVQKADGTVVTLNAESTGAFDQQDANIDPALIKSAKQLQHAVVENPSDISLIAPGASMSFASTSNLSDSNVQMHDGLSDMSRFSRHHPQLPVALTPTVKSLYQPVKIHNLVESIRDKQHNIKGLEVLVDSLHHAQFTDTPRLYPCLGVHPQPLSQEMYYVRSMFNPLQNAFGVTTEEKYVRGLLGCIDLTLMRNAAEYQRWLHLVPVDRETMWDKIQGTILSWTGIDVPSLLSEPSPGREAGYLDRRAMPGYLKAGYDGTWAPHTTDPDGEVHHHRKPVRYDTQLGEESWVEWIYRNMGWSMQPTLEDHVARLEREAAAQGKEFRSGEGQIDPDSLNPINTRRPHEALRNTTE